ncbi:uncharacterized protein LOC126791567 [Argentina anserina]|uniref:uncharacterized protein LOC126791567 n=1 Tax=Argentina anserina TaxID=57926 RepID=UPI00217625E7|nr:uncharacterized protein LOC126791567 [Potentilla anserina]
MSVSCCDPVVKSKRGDSKSVTTSVDDLPEVALVEILCRLPSCKFVVQCKCVSKRWCNVLSDHYMIGRFLWVKLEKIAPIVTRTSPVVNSNFGRQLFTAEVFGRLRSLLGLTKNPLVLATWNDLALCSADRYHRPSYFICNPRTMHLVTLPPVPRCDRRQPVGFICEPYYYKEDRSDIGVQNLRQVVKFNGEFRFKVVRILLPDKPRKTCFKFKIQVFSSEIGEWRESVVPCPRGCPSCDISVNGFAGNGMLYWNADYGILVLGPFTNAADDHGYQFHVIWTFMDKFTPVCLGVYEGCLLFYDYCSSSENPIFELCIWKLTEEELNQMAVDGGGKLGRNHKKHYLNLMFLMDLDSDNDLDLSDADVFGFKPTNLDIFYVRLGEAYFKGNIRTGWLSEVDVKSYHDECSLCDVSSKIFRSLLPWPTPVPRLPERVDGLN